MNRRLAAVTLGLLAGFTAGCGQSRCKISCASVCDSSPITLVVRDAATGALVPGVTATSPGLTCSAGSGAVYCPAPAGTYVVTVSAPGYVTTTLTASASYFGASEPCLCVDPCACLGPCPTTTPDAVALPRS